MKHFIEEDSNVANFPAFQLNELKEFTMGSYQLKQGMSYISEHLKKNQKFELFECPSHFVSKFFTSLAQTQQDIVNLKVGSLDLEKIKNTLYLCLSIVRLVGEKEFWFIHAIAGMGSELWVVVVTFVQSLLSWDITDINNVK